jgi:hypothetical protein
MVTYGDDNLLFFFNVQPKGNTFEITPLGFYIVQSPVISASWTKDENRLHLVCDDGSLFNIAFPSVTTTELVEFSESQLDIQAFIFNLTADVAHAETLGLAAYRGLGLTDPPEVEQPWRIKFDEIGKLGGPFIARFIEYLDDTLALAIVETIDAEEGEIRLLDLKDPTRSRYFF